MGTQHNMHLIPAAGIKGKPVTTNICEHVYIMQNLVQEIKTLQEKIHG